MAKMVIYIYSEGLSNEEIKQDIEKHPQPLLHMADYMLLADDIGQSSLETFNTLIKDIQLIKILKNRYEIQ